MKAVSVHPASREVRLIDAERPALHSPSDVLLRILEVGVCGTDREIADCQYGTPPKGFDHLVIGHESLGEVVEVGRAVRGLAPGDLVVPMVRRPCRHEHCLPCRAERQDFCTTGDFRERGIKEAHGFMTEYVVDDQRYMVPVPRELREVAVLVEPLTIAEKALAQLAVIQQRLPWTCPIERGANGARASERHTCHRAVVIGAGPVGLLGAMALRNAGFETTVYSKTPAPNDRSLLIESIGGRYVSSEGASPEQLAEVVGGIDVVYEAVGASQVAFEVLRVLGTNGIFIFTGVPARKGPIQIDSDLLMRNIVLKNQVVLGSVNAGRGDFESAIRDLTEFLERWPEAVRSLISARHPVRKARELLVERGAGIKNVLAFSGMPQ
jgi:threonine dehydrogenase-like Zn-dependent dehydrogenase